MVKQRIRKVAHGIAVYGDIRNYTRAGKIAYLAVTCVFLTSVLVPTLMSIAENRRTKLNNQIASLLDNPSEKLAKKITYNPQKATYVFNQAEKRVESASPIEALQQQITGKNGSEKSLYSVDMPTDISRGFTYYDNNLGLSFELQPQNIAGQGALSNNRLVYALSDGSKAIFTAKSNGIKEDVILTSPPKSDEYILRYDLKLPKTLEARMLEDGSLGIYSADPQLYGNISYGGDSDKAKVQSARETGTKDHLVFGIPAPVVKEQGNATSGTSSKFLLSNDGKTLTVATTGLSKARYPLSIDPSIVITSTSDFETGNRDSSIDFANNQIQSFGVTGGTLGTFTTTNTPVSPDLQTKGVAYNGYFYMISSSDTGTTNTMKYTKINGDGTLATWQTQTIDMNVLHPAITAYNGYMYILGGTSGNASNAQTTARYAKINSDGTLGSVLTTTSMINGKYRFNVVGYNGYLYQGGGQRAFQAVGAQTWGNIEYAKVNADGTLGNWTSINNAFELRQGFGMAAYNGYLYIVGGSDDAGVGGTNVNNIRYARIDPLTGVPGTFGTVAIPATPGSFINGVTRAYGGYLYMLGGTNVTATYVVKITANGVPSSTWTAGTSYPAGNVDYQASDIYNGYAYFSGGRINNNQGIGLNTYYAPIDAAGKTTTYTDSGRADTSNRAGNDAVAYNGYLYTSGGTNNNGALGSTVYLDDIRYAVINSDGSIGTWQTTTSFNTGRYGHQMVAYNGYMYIMGGTSDPSTVYNTVQYAPINTNGTLGTFATTTNLVNPTHSFGADAFNGRMYMVGGAGTGATAYTTSYYATINANGTLGAWQTGTSILREARYAGFKLVGNRMYLSGGVSGNGATYNNQVQYATIQNDGSIGTWADSAATFSNARNGHRFIHYGGYFYIIGGTNGAGEGTRLGDVQYAPLLSDGSIGTWSTNTSLPGNLAKGGGVVYGDKLYIVDGFNNGGTASNTTYIATVKGPGSGKPSAATWTASTSFTTGRRDHGYVAYNGYMYISGGVSAAAGSGESDVQYAPINADGTLGTWVATTSLNNPRYGHSMVAYNNIMYVVDGNVGGGASTSIISAPINTDGTLGTWTAANPNNLNRRQHSTAIYNGYMYVMGGAINPAINSFRASVEYAKINNDGTIGTWTTAPLNFTSNRGNLMGFVYGGYVYVMGGFNGINNANVLQDVQYAKINSDGSVAAAWQVASRLPFATGGAGYAMYNGYVYIAGGLDTNAARVNTFQSGQVMADGDIHDWQYVADGATSNFVNRRDGLGLVAYKGYLYVMGGLGPSTAYYNDTQYMPLDTVSRTSHYSKLVDIGSDADLQSISYNGMLNDGPASIRYATAPQTAIFNTTQYSGNVTPIVSGNFCALVGANRYVYLTVALRDDDMFAVFPAVSGPRANVQDMTLSFNISLNAPPDARLLNGKWFYQGTLQPYAACPS